MRYRGLVVFSLLLFVAAACTSQSGPAPSPGITASAVPTALPDVSPAATQPLPPWITEISPKGQAADGAQIRIRFQNDVAPLEALESPETAAVLSHVSIEPAIPGRFILLTPKMIGFEADAAIPHASRIAVTLTAGLSDTKGHSLAADYRWSFTTVPITISQVTGQGVAEKDAEPVSLNPQISITTSDAVDLQSLLAHAHVTAKKTGASPIPLVVAPTPSADPNAPADSPADAPGANPDDTSQTYTLVPQTALERDTAYDVAVDPGVKPVVGNLAVAAKATGLIKTYGDFAFSGVTTVDTPGTSSESVTFSGGAPELDFSNAVDGATVAQAVTVSPTALPGTTLARASDRTVSINPVALMPNTKYTFSIATSLADQFGQKLPSAASGSFTTGDYVGDIWAPNGLTIFPAGPDLRLNVETTDLPSGTYQLATKPLTPLDLIGTDLTQADASTFFASPWPSIQAPKSRNVVVKTPISIAQRLGASAGVLAYAATAREFQYLDSNGKLTWEQPVYSGFAELTNLGVFAQWFPSGGMVRVHHLADGMPVAGAHVDIYQSLTGLDEDQRTKLATVAKTPCATGTTDAAGSWQLDNAAFTKCASTATSADDAPALLAVVREGADWAWARTDRYSGASFEDVYAGWSAGTPVSYGTIVSDRTLYQPGEAAHFTAIGYFDENGVLERGRSKQYDVKISDPDGNAIDAGTYSLDLYGAFSFAYSLPKSAKVGYYSITATGQNNEAISGNFRVAEFRPPTFAVDLKLDKEFVEAGSSANAAAKSTYLFGAPVEGATTRVTVTREQTAVQPAGWDAFEFGRSWDWPEQPPSVAPDVSQSDIKTAADGSITAGVPVDATLPYPMTYTVDADTTDVANLSVADTKTFTALPSSSLIGLKADFVGTAKTPLTISTIVTDPHGAAQSSKSVHIVLQRRDDISAEMLDEGSVTAHQAVHYSDVAAADVTSGDKPVDTQLTPGKPGSYRIVANFSASTGPSTETDRFLWVSGPGEADWFARDPNQLTIKLDKKTYRPGDTATALVQSPYGDAEIYLAVLRHGVLYQTTQVVHGAAPQLSFKVTSAMLPNAAVEAVVVRRGPPLGNAIPAGIEKLAKVGMEPFEVALDGKYLKVAVAPQAPRIEPGASQHVAFTLTGADGKPAAGEVVVAVVNDAILQMTGYRYPDLVKTVYADEPISERLADNRFLVSLVTQAKTVDKGFGYGGGASSGPGSTRTRTKFEPLAYFNGSVHAGPDGAASVDFTLPDDLTTWRVLAMALTPDARFGTADATFIASKPLVTEAILPQFARPGDRFSAGVAVTDIAKTGGNVDIAGQLGGSLGFGDPQSPNPQATMQAPIDALTAAYRFDVAVNGTSPATVQFSTKLGPNSDAFRLDLPIRTQDVTEDVVETGATQTQASVPVKIDSKLPNDVGGLEVQLASTLLPEALGIVNELYHDPNPFADDLGGRIGIESNAMMLDKLYGAPKQMPELQKWLAADLVDLRALGRSDGGYAEYKNAPKSDLFATAFVAQQLAAAKLAGIDVGADIARVHPYLVAKLGDPGECEHDAVCIAEIRLILLRSLAANGDVRADHLDDIAAQSDKLRYGEQLALARQEALLPAWHDRAITLRDKLLEQVYESGRRASVNEPTPFWTSQVSTQAEALELMLDTKMPADRIDRTFTSLWQSRINGTAVCLCEDAATFTSLVDYAKSQGPPPNFTASAKLGALALASGTFQGYGKTSVDSTTPMKSLPRGAQTLTASKTGTGRLHYAVDLRYGISGNAPGIYHGIRIDRNVRNAGSAPIIASLSLAAPTAPTLDPGKVYEIEDRITTDHPLDSLVVIDPLPAGLEAVDTSLRTTSSAYVANADSWQIDDQEIYRDRVLSYSQHLEAGTYAIHYLVRSVTPGTFAWPAATVTEKFAPDEFGRTAQTTLTISPVK